MLRACSGKRTCLAFQRLPEAGKADSVSPTAQGGAEVGSLVVRAGVGHTRFLASKGTEE